MNIYWKYYKAGYKGQIWPQAPGLKWPSVKRNGRVNNCPAIYKREYISEWFDGPDSDCGICIIARYFPFVDIDIDDEPTASRVAKVVQANLGPAMIRRRDNSPRLGLIYRTEYPFK